MVLYQYFVRTWSSPTVSSVVLVTRNDQSCNIQPPLLLWTAIYRPLIYLFTAWTQPLYVTKSAFKPYFILNSTRHKKAPCSCKRWEMRQTPFSVHLLCSTVLFLTWMLPLQKPKVLSQVLQPLLDFVTEGFISLLGMPPQIMFPSLRASKVHGHQGLL